MTRDALAPIAKAAERILRKSGYRIAGVETTWETRDGRDVPVVRVLFDDGEQRIEGAPEW